MPYTSEGKHMMLDKLTGVANAQGPITHAALHTAVPSTGTPNEVTGGSPAYARKAIAFAAAAAGIADDTVVSRVFDVPAGVTVTHVGFWSAVTGGQCLGYAAVTNETFGAQGTYTLTDAKLDLNL